MKWKKWILTSVLLTANLGGTAANAVEVDLSRVGVQRVAPNMIRLRNVNVPGLGNYWADMEWDPQGNVFRVSNAGRDEIPQLTVTTARYSVAQNSAPNLSQACTQEFGPASRQADWQDIKGSLGNDNLAIQSFLEDSRIVPGDYYLITYGNNILTDRGYPYFMAAGRSGGVPKESLAGEALTANYTSSTITGRVVCVNLEAVDFPP